jgi:acetyl-CoA synthetase
LSDHTLEQRLGEPLTVDRFPVPAAFREQAGTDSEALYRHAVADRLSFWAEQARTLNWDKPFTWSGSGSSSPGPRTSSNVS